MNLNLILKNKVVLYLTSRYVTYAVQFVTSLVVAAKLGPYYMGIWGFILLVMQYFQQIHLGIANSFNVLYVQNHNCGEECKNYIGNSLILLCYLSLLVVLFYLYYIVFGISSFEKYHIKSYVIWICLVAVLQYFVQFFINLFRVKNQLTKVIFCQSIIIFLNFICIFFLDGRRLINALVVGYVIGNLLCIMLAFASGVIPKFSTIQFSLDYQKKILKKGLFLFLYNSCFYFIIISIRTIISVNYTIIDFGVFTFSYTLAHAILLLLEALSFIIFPKVIGKLSSAELDKNTSTIDRLRMIYITSAHGLIYTALICFPLLLWFFPKYESALTVLNFIALTILMSFNSYGYIDLLIAQNRENTSALLSLGALIVNCALALFLVLGLHCTFEYVILATMVTYLLFSVAVVLIASRLLNKNFAWRDWFPIRLIVPYVIAMLISFYKLVEYSFIPLFVFFLLNHKQICEVKTMALLLLKQPNKINL